MWRGSYLYLVWLLCIQRWSCLFVARVLFNFGCVCQRVARVLYVVGVVAYIQLAFVSIKALRTFGCACLHLATVLSTLSFVALHLAWVFFICRWRLVYVWLGWLTCGQSFVYVWFARRTFTIQGGPYLLVTALFIFWIGRSTRCQGVDPVWFVCLTCSRDFFSFWLGHCLLLGWLEYSFGKAFLTLGAVASHLAFVFFCF